jgi:hypothetical protein
MCLQRREARVCTPPSSLLVSFPPSLPSSLPPLSLFLPPPLPHFLPPTSVPMECPSPACLRLAHDDALRLPQTSDSSNLPRKTARGPQT